MAKDAEIGNGTNFTTRSTKNLPLDMAEDAKIDGRVMEVMMKQSKDHLPRS